MQFVFKKYTIQIGQNIYNVQQKMNMIVLGDLCKFMQDLQT